MTRMSFDLQRALADALPRTPGLALADGFHGPLLGC